jgi:hypothetical protein
MSFCAINSPRSVVSTWTICPAEDGRRFPENSRAVNVGTCFPPRLQTEAIVAVVCTSKKLHSAREARTQRILAASIGEAGLLPVARSVRRRHCLRVSSPVPFWFGGGNECGAASALVVWIALGGSGRERARRNLPPSLSLSSRESPSYHNPLAAPCCVAGIAAVFFSVQPRPAFTISLEPPKPVGTNISPVL